MKAHQWYRAEVLDNRWLLPVLRGETVDVFDNDDGWWYIRFDGGSLWRREDDCALRILDETTDKEHQS